MNNHDLYNTISILGAGESGVGAAILAASKGLDVFVSDYGKIKNEYRKVLLHHDIKFEEGKHSKERILKSDLIIKSPGIPDNAPIIQEINQMGTKIISEIEFAGRYTDAKKICITGSNGKTTTTLLTGHILKKAGINAGIAGNVGRSFAWQVAAEEHDVYVLEISSFQLDDMYDFKADVAVIMNITPDHLDRYNYDFQSYINSKFRITQNQTESNHLIYCLDDAIITRELENRNIKAKKIPFSIYQNIKGNGACVIPPFEKDKKTETKNKQIRVTINTEEQNMTLEKLALQGKHNLYNSMAASVAARVLDLRNEVIKESMSDFQNIEHRLEPVATIHGIEFINDSKATNVNSAWFALESVNKPIIWIAGGVDKGNDYSQLKELVREKVSAIVCLGLDNSNIYNAFKGDVETIIETHSATEAVEQAYDLADHGYAILLSPACASFDLFSNYEDRGRKFKDAVKKL